VASERGDYSTAERHLREAIRLLKLLEDRGTLCESQRALAEALVAQAKIDEAERFALEATETVGKQDVSSQATTKLSLALVRSAQGRDDEAEQLLREALADIEVTGFRDVELWSLQRLDRFLRERGRPDELVTVRLSKLAPIAAIGSAFEGAVARP
jgi:tetratricopeptide (TPR) repeat protein